MDADQFKSRFDIGTTGFIDDVSGRCVEPNLV